MTQAINLANFSNSLDTSGGVPPSQLNAPVPISKGGTNGTTAASARTNLGVDYPTLAVQIGQLIFSVGSIYSNTSDSTNPATLLGFGTWAAIGAGRVTISAGGSYTAGSTGGSADAVVVSHTHTATSTVTDPTHRHQMLGGGTSPGGGGGIGGGDWNTSSSPNQYTSYASTGITVATTNTTTGVSGTGANLPPYLVVYMWQRTA